MRRVLLTPRWLALHVLAVAAVAVCLRLSVWQFGRAGEGNGRSFGYALQWPGFGAFIVGVWVWLARDAVRGGPRIPDPTPAHAPGRVPDDVVLPPVRDYTAAGVGAADAGEDDDLAAYNRMLAALHERDRP